MEIQATGTTGTEIMVATITTTAMEMAGVGDWAAAIEEDADTEATVAMDIDHWVGGLVAGDLAH
jgi:hypothetical protein